MSAIEFGHRALHKPDGSTADGWHSYTCGHCGRDVSGVVVAYAQRTPAGFIYWLQCSACHDASVQSGSGAVHPGVPFGPLIDGLPPDVAGAYEEARSCFSVSAYTAAEMLSRKILMHIAVDKGAAEGGSFAGYIDYLQTAGFVTPPMKEWVTLIKNHGNAANHRLDPPDKSRAEGTLYFTAQLLRSVYEMGHLAGKFTPKPGGAA